MTSSQRRVVMTLGFCGLVSAADNWFVSPALPAIAQALSVLPSAAAIILTAYLIPYGLLQPVCGAIGDAVGRVRLLRIIVMGLSISTFLCAAVSSLPFLIVARIITGCFAAGIISVSQALVGDIVSERERGGAVGLLMGITFTGQGLSAGLGGIITDLVGWRAAFAAFGILGIAAWMGLLGLRGLSGKVNDPVTAATNATSIDSGLRDASKPSFPRTNPVASFLSQAFKTFFGKGRAVFLAACSTGIIFLGVYGCMGTFLAERCGLTSTAAGLLMMFYGVACLIGGTISGRIGATRGLTYVIHVGEAAGIAAIATLALTSITGSWVPALTAAAFLGLGYILVQPTPVSLSMDADPQRTGLCTGLVGLGVFAGGGIGSAFGEIIIAANGYLVLWLCAGIALLLQIVLSSKPLSRTGMRHM